MATINDVKDLAVPDTPLLFFQCALPGGDTQYWCTHGIFFNGVFHAPRILKHNLFDLALSADDAMDGLSQVSVTLANADGKMTELNTEGFKGSQLTVYFAFANLSTGTITTESSVLFRGVAGDPDEISDESLSLTFTNKLTLQRIPLPEVRIQRSCPWNFPATPDQRAEAVAGGVKGRFSRFYRCGYSPDFPGGVGNQSATQKPFTTCDKTRTNCIERGLFGIDSAGHALNNGTNRFGGLEFIPSAILVRTAGDKTSHVSPLVDNAASYNDPVPLVYGTGWLQSPVIFARNDGNLTHMETLLGMGVIDGILKVVVNNVEIPAGVSGQDMSASGWYSLVSSGDRAGNFNLDFTDNNQNPLGDPHGSLASLSVVVPTRISSGSSVANVEVLLRGVHIDTYSLDLSNNLIGPTTSYSDNPAWIILDILRRCGWAGSELDLATFVNAASFCDYVIETQDLNGLKIAVSRYKCNLILTRRQSAAAVVRGIRVGSSLMLRYGFSGLLELVPETTIAGQRPAAVPPDGGNSIQTLNGGWPAFEFSDNSTFSGIVRNAKGQSTLRLISNSVAQTTNRLSVEFQDEMNEYQQDSLSVVDAGDVDLIGYENSSQSTALGLPSFSQANRVLLRQLDKSTKGNQYVQFQTSFRALKVRPGDIVALTYGKTNFVRTPFRVVKLSPSLNYELVTVLAQIHDDDWYSDDPAIEAGAGRQPGSQTQTPLPLIGAHTDGTSPLLDANGFFEFGVTEVLQTLSDGTTIDTISVAFRAPVKPASNSSHVPLLSLSPNYGSTDGTLAGGANFYYAVTAVDAAGGEGPLSFTVAASIPAGTNTNTVTLRGLSFPASAVAFNVYRGTTPQLLYSIAHLQTIAFLFLDNGLPAQPLGPPDASFDHANFYYRYQYAGPFFVTSASSTTISQTDLGAVGVNYAGRVVRVMQGKGSGQERSVASNTSTTVTVTPAWSVVPDASSIFCIVQGSWTFAAVCAISPAQFQIGFRPGTYIQISGRAANVNNLEGSPDLCPVVQYKLGGVLPDSDVPSTPSFHLDAPGAGFLSLSQIAFSSPIGSPVPPNIAAVTSGTLQLFSWNELNSPSPFILGTAMDAVNGTLQVQVIGVMDSTQILVPGRVIQIDHEILIIRTADAASNAYTAVRGQLESLVAPHTQGAAVLPLDSATIVVPFAVGFFESTASINFLHTFSLPDVRVGAAQFSVTNRFGDSQADTICYTLSALPSSLLRTLSGGQFSLQSNGYIATQQNATPPLLVQATHAVRDMRATLGQAAIGFNIAIALNRNGAPYSSLVIPSGTTVSPILAGFDFISNVQLAPLQEKDLLTMDITLNPTSPFPSSPSPGRDLTLTIRF